MHTSHSSGPFEGSSMLRVPSRPTALKQATPAKSPRFKRSFALHNTATVKPSRLLRVLRRKVNSSNAPNRFLNCHKILLTWGFPEIPSGWPVTKEASGTFPTFDLTLKLCGRHIHQNALCCTCENDPMPQIPTVVQNQLIFSQNCSIPGAWL